MDADYARRPSSKRLILLVSILGSSLGFIDSSVVSVALPAIQQGLDADLATVQWASNGYLLTLASLILTGGAIGDRFGTLRAFKIGLAAFVVSSIGCALAPSALILIVARLVQGAAAALLVPTSLALVSQTFSGDARGKAIGTWSAAGGLLMAFGPPLGGWLVDSAGWRSIFYINVPIGCLALIMAAFVRVGSENRADVRLDMRGAILATLALGLLTYGLIALGDGNRVPGIIATSISVPVFALFIAAEHKNANPMMPLALFKDRNFSGANALTVILYGGLTATLFLLPFFLIKAKHYSASEAGAAFIPLSVILGLGSRYTGDLASKIGRRLPLIWGPVITAAGFASLAILSERESFWVSILPGLVLIGVGMTIVVPALTTTVFDSAPDEQSGAASGINNAAARGGGLIATAAIGLAFGTSDLGSVSPEQLSAAFVTVMWCAVATSTISAACALIAINAPPPR